MPDLSFKIGNVEVADLPELIGVVEDIRRLKDLIAGWVEYAAFESSRLVPTPSWSQVSCRSHFAALRCIFSYSGFHSTLIMWPGAMKQTRPMP
jgi:hypothetical protein